MPLKFQWRELVELTSQYLLCMCVCVCVYVCERESVCVMSLSLWRQSHDMLSL